MSVHVSVFWSEYFWYFRACPPVFHALSLEFRKKDLLSQPFHHRLQLHKILLRQLLPFLILVVVLVHLLPWIHQPGESNNQTHVWDDFLSYNHRQMHMCKKKNRVTSSIPNLSFSHTPCRRICCDFLARILHFLFFLYFCYFRKWLWRSHWSCLYSDLLSASFWTSWVTDRCFFLNSS